MSAQAANLAELSDAEYKKRTRAWAMYDWANSAFATTILAAVLPVYYSQVAGSTLPSAAVATQYWSITLSISVFIVALMSPILGTVSDIMRGKKKFLSLFVAIGVVGTGFLVLIDSGDWLLASILFIVGRIGFGAANVFYDALLPHVAREEDQDKVSTYGYALGYLGGGILLAINVVMIFTLDGNWGVRYSLLSVAIWWAIFSIPIFRTVPEPDSVSKRLLPGESLWRVSFGQIRTTLRNISEYRELFRYLIAFLIYNDGIGIVISVAAIYGAELGFGSTELILAILLVQFVGIPYSLVFGNLPSQGNKWQPVFVAFVVFNIIALPLVGIFGSQILDQSLTGTPSPDFVARDGAVGQGSNLVTETNYELAGGWQEERIAADLIGAGCSWYAFWCDEAENDAFYLQAADAGDNIGLTFNGQAIKVTYATGPDFGIWSVAIDGTPLLDDDGEPILIDAYSESLRYGVTTNFQAEEEGIHRLNLTSEFSQNEASSGALMAIADVEVLPPSRSSNLIAIIGILLGTQLVASLFALALGRTLFSGMAAWLDTKRSILVALSAYAIIAVWGYFLNSVIEFWFLAWLVAIVQGGSQALSRSLYSSMTPTAKSGEFFGFFSIMSKFASFLSPLVFVLAVSLFGSSRPGVLSLILFFGVGMWLLNRVDVEAGRARAKAVDAELAAAD